MANWLRLPSVPRPQDLFHVLCGIGIPILILIPRCKQHAAEDPSHHIPCRS